MEGAPGGTEGCPRRDGGVPPRGTEGCPPEGRRLRKPEAPEVVETNELQRYELLQRSRGRVQETHAVRRVVYVRKVTVVHDRVHERALCAVVEGARHLRGERRRGERRGGAGRGEAM